MMMLFNYLAVANYNFVLCQLSINKTSQEWNNNCDCECAFLSTDKKDVDAFVGSSFDRVEVELDQILYFI